MKYYKRINNLSSTISLYTDKEEQKLSKTCDYASILE